MILAANSAAQAAAAVVESSEAVNVVTEYSSTKVPVITMVMVAVSILLVIAAAIAGFIYVVKHFQNWGTGVISGVLAQLLFCFLIYVLIMFGLSKLEAWSTWSAENEDGANLVAYLISMFLNLSAVLLGVMYAVNSARRKSLPVNVGLALGFAAAFLVSSLMEGQQITYPFQYIMISMSVNDMGFDAAVASMMEGGIAEEEAIGYLLQLCRTDWVNYLCEDLSVLLSAVANACGAVLFCGLFDDRLDSKWYGYAIGGMLLFWVPGLLSGVLNISSPVLTALMLLVDAAFIYVTYKALAKEMPEDWQLMKAKGSRIVHEKKKEEPPKMPKINMPVD